MSVVLENMRKLCGKRGNYAAILKEKNLGKLRSEGYIIILIILDIIIYPGHYLLGNSECYIITKPKEKLIFFSFTIKQHPIVFYN